MNYFKHHIGDYDSATAHLSWLEDMAYTRLMRLYYRRELPIPPDVSQACRLVRALSKPEREAVATVLAEFFVLQDDGWHNARCDEEIQASQEKAELNRTVGKRGGRPKKSETMMVSENNPDGFQTETQTVSEQNPNVTLAISHKPIAISHKPEDQVQKSLARASRLPDSGERPFDLPADWFEFARTENPLWTDHDIQRMADNFADYWTALGGSRGAKRDWLATWRTWVRKENDRGTHQRNHPPRIDNSAPARVERAIAERDRARAAARAGNGPPVAADEPHLRPPVDGQFRDVR